MISREWLVKVRFWPLFFIAMSGWFTWICFKWVTGLEVRGDYDIALPIAAFGLTADLVKKFTDTKQDQQ